MGLIARIIHEDDDDRTLVLKATEFLSTEKKVKTSYLPSEWQRQSFIQIAWPHPDTDWNYMLDEVTDCYLHVAYEIAQREDLLIVTPDISYTQEQISMFLDNECPSLKALITERIHYFSCDTNDTWARDHAFITMIDENGPVLMDFRFNAWGQKFASDLDNQICRKMYQAGIAGGRYCNKLDFVLEGGSVESDGCGTMLTTSECLLSPNRNDTMDKAEIDSYLMKTFNLSQVLWLDHGYLAGDDTDSHIDTLARLCPHNTIVYTCTKDRDDEHYDALNSMKEQLRTFRNLDGEPYRLLELPLPAAIYDKDNGERLPATYANFLIMNKAVLYPTYGQRSNDDKASVILSEAFPGYEIVGIDCRALIRQHGSLHCITMQYPEQVGLKK